MSGFRYGPSSSAVLELADQGRIDGEKQTDRNRGSGAPL